MRLVVELDGSSPEFTERGTDAAYPYLDPDKTSSIRMQARIATSIGLGSNESPNMTIVLDNSDGKVAETLGDALRARATFYDDDELPFVGAISRMEYGNAITLQIDA